MREIKFRVWDKTYKKMYYHDYPYSWDCDEHCIKFFVNSPEENLDGDVIPMQFTGLKDKNGKEIYEGDVVYNSNRTLLTCPARTYLVVWQEGVYNDGNTWLKESPGFRFRKIQPPNARYMALIFNQSQIEVIGNIYEHEHLLHENKKSK